MYERVHNQPSVGTKAACLSVLSVIFQYYDFIDKKLISLFTALMSFPRSKVFFILIRNKKCYISYLCL